MKKERLAKNNQGRTPYFMASATKIASHDDFIEYEYCDDDIFLDEFRKERAKKEGE